MRTSALLVSLVLTVSLPASDFERVLLPVTVFDVPGAHGSLWRSELWAHIRVGGVVILPIRIADAQPFRAGSHSVPVFLRRSGEPPGQFIIVTRERLDDVDFYLRVRDQSRLDETWGTEIPVVRESRFRSEAIAFVPVPLDEARFRNTLRVYAANEEGGEVRVRITLLANPPAAARVIHESVHHLGPTGHPYLPPYAEVTFSGSGESGAARVDVEPLSADLRFWAFVSTTHNATQHVTTITPQ